MTLAPDTLLVVNVANVLVLAITLPFAMGDRLSPSAADARRALIVQAVGWIALILSARWPDGWFDGTLSTLAMASISGANWLLYRSLSGWLGPRPLRLTLAFLALAMPLGYALSFPSYAVRVGWSNLLIACQLLIVARAALFPNTALRGRWRWILSACLAAMATFTAGRGILGAFYTELYPYFASPHPFNIAALIVANVTLVLINVSVLVAWREEAEGELRAQATTDPLTGVLNRHGWNERAQAAVAHAMRHRQPLSLLTLDLDHFKQINDSRGHEAGDAALRLFGELLRSGQRAGDVVARIGGEEFCALLPLADESAAYGFDQRLRAGVAAAAPPRLNHGLNFSAGLALLCEGDTLETLMRRSDDALYRAKQAGRGRLEKAVA